MYGNGQSHWNRPIWGYNNPNMAPTPAPQSVLPPIRSSLDDSPELLCAEDVNRFQFWKQNNHWPTTYKGMWPQEPGAEASPRTTFQMTFAPRKPTSVNIHHRNRLRSSKVDHILPDDPKDWDVRLLPSVDREKMVELPSKLGGPKKLMDAPTGPAGVFYTDQEAELSKDDPKYWKSLSALAGKEFSRKKEILPRPTQMAVHYFNGGAPASPLRKNRRTMHPMKRCDSSRVDFNLSLYGKDKEDKDNNYV